MANVRRLLPVDKRTRINPEFSTLIEIRAEDMHQKSASCALEVSSSNPLTAVSQGVLGARRHSTFLDKKERGEGEQSRLRKKERR